MLYNNISENSWTIKSPTFVLEKNEYQSHIKIWKKIFKEGFFQNNQKYLMINDGCQIFKNSLTTPSDIVIVDPLSYQLCEEPYKTILYTTSFKNTKDSLGYSHKLVLIDETFKEAYEDACFTTKYDHICLRVNTLEDLSFENIEKYFLLLKDFGCFFIQASSSFFDDKSVKDNLEHYFSLLSTKFRAIQQNNDLILFNAYRKITSLI